MLLVQVARPVRLVQPVPRAVLDSPARPAQVVLKVWQVQPAQMGPLGLPDHLARPQLCLVQLGQLALRDLRVSPARPQQLALPELPGRKARAAYQVQTERLAPPDRKAIRVRQEPMALPGRLVQRVRLGRRPSTV